MKICTLCNIEKEDKHFNGIQRQCKDCVGFLNSLRHEYKGDTDIEKLARQASIWRWHYKQTGTGGY